MSDDAKSEHANLLAIARSISGAWRPQAALGVNQATLRVVRFDSRAPEFHTHDIDECYVVLEGELIVEIEGEASTHVAKGAAFVVRAGTKHRPFAMPSASVLLIT